MTRLIIVRHGRTAWNREERFRGRTDVPLDAVGEKQVEACARAIAARFRPAAVYASPLQRTVRTAEAIGRQCHVATELHDGLIDMSFGEAEGLTWPEADARFPGLGSAWRDTPHTATFPGGETLAAVRARLVTAATALAERHPGQEVVLVGHNATNRALLLAALDLGDERFWRIGQEPAAINLVALEDGAFTVLTLNDTCHLNEIILEEEKTR